MEIRVKCVAEYGGLYDARLPRPGLGLAAIPCSHDLNAVAAGQDVNHS
jgi:hypothetical protein